MMGDEGGSEESRGGDEGARDVERGGEEGGRDESFIGSTWIS